LEPIQIFLSGIDVYFSKANVCIQHKLVGMLMIMRPICKSGDGCQLQKDFIGISAMGISIIIKPNNRPSDETAWPHMDSFVINEG